MDLPKFTHFGEVLFPIEIEQNWEVLNSLYLRKHIHWGLAGAAKHGNARAFYHLAEAIENHFLCSEDSTMNQFAALLKKIALRKGKEKDPVLLSWLADSLENKRKILSKTEDPEALYELALLTKDNPTQQKKLFEESSRQNCKQASLQLALDQKEKKDRREAPLKLDLPAAQFFAALLSKKTDRLKLLQKAGSMGHMLAYETLMEHYWKLGQLEKVEEYILKMQHNGDHLGWITLGNWYRTAGNVDKAKECYQKVGAHAFLAQVAQDPEEKKTHEANAISQTELHFNAIKNFLDDLVKIKNISV